MYKLLVQPSFSGSWSLLHSLHDDRQANSWIRTCLVSVPGFAGLKKATGNVANSSLVLTIHPSTWGWKTIVWKVWSFCLKLVHSAFFNKILRPNHLAKSAVLVASPRCRCFFFAEEVCTWWPLIHDQPGMVRVGSTGWIPFMKFWTFNRFSERFTGSTNKLTCAPFLELQLSRVKKTEMKYLESLDAFPKFGTLILWLDLDPLVLEVIWMLEWWQDTHHSRTSAPSSLHHTKTQWNCVHSQILSSHILSVEGYATIRLRLCLNHKLDVRQKMMDWDFHGRKSDPLNNSIPKSKQSKQFCSQFKPNSFFATMRVFFFRLFLSFFRLFIFLFLHWNGLQTLKVLLFLAGRVVGHHVLWFDPPTWFARSSFHCSLPNPWHWGSGKGTVGWWDEIDEAAASRFRICGGRWILEKKGLFHFCLSFKMV